MRIIVTGSSGGLGSAVVRDLLAAGHDVRPIDMHPPGHEPGVQTTCMNLTDVRSLTRAFVGADAVCHLANLPQIPNPPTTDGFVNNVGATHAAFESAVASGVNRVVLASSLQAYGTLTPPGREHVPVSVPLYLPVDEHHPLLPTDASPPAKQTASGSRPRFADRCRRYRSCR